MPGFRFAVMIANMCFRSLRRASAALAVTLPVAAHAAAAEPAPPAAPPHHRDGEFQNNYVDFEPKGLLELLRWRWQAARDGLPQPPREPTATVPPDLAFIHANARAGKAMQPAVTWIGHATVLAQMGGMNVVTDPMFSQRASPFTWAGPQRLQPPGLSLAQLPRIDVVLVSHNHYDHLDEASVRALNGQVGGPPLFVVPLGLKAWLAGIGIEDAVELDWWQSHRAGPLEIVLTPVQHWSGRHLTDRMQTLWGGFAVLAPDLHLFFAGDTGYSKDFSDIRERLAPRQRDRGFDIALIPVGAYEPRWFMAPQHVNPEEAVRMHLDLGAKRTLGVHWGTFELSDESLDAPPRALARARHALGVPDSAFFVMAIGETRTLPRRGEAQ